MRGYLCDVIHHPTWKNNQDGGIVIFVCYCQVFIERNKKSIYIHESKEFRDFL